MSPVGEWLTEDSPFPGGGGDPGLEQVPVSRSATCQTIEVGRELR